MCKLIRTLFLATTVFLAPFALLSQTNLVPNPSFEETNTCALAPFWGLDTTWFTDPAQYRAAQYWISPNRESPDYCNACQSDGSFYSVPSNAQGFQDAKDGQAYIGIICYEKNIPFAPNGESREYIQTQLISDLEPAAIYRGRFYTSPSYYVNEKFNVISIDNMAMAITRQ